VAPGVDLARCDEEAHADVAELAVRERGSGVACVALAAADEEPESAQRGGRIAGHRRRVVAHQRIPEVVEGRACGDERFLERGERLAHVHQHRHVVRGRRASERMAVVAREHPRAAHHARHRLRRHAHLARLQDRPDALRPEVVARAVPAEPMRVPHVGDRRRVAFGDAEADPPLVAVGPGLLRLVARGAGDEPVLRQARVEEQPLAERDRAPLCRRAVRRVTRPRRRPGSVREHFRALDRVERLRVGKRRQREHAPCHDVPYEAHWATLRADALRGGFALGAALRAHCSS